MLPWIRRRSSSFILFAVLILSLVGVGFSLYMDNEHQIWSSEHPLTANLLAGFLGLPAAFLVVNLAAERAIAWSEQTKWAAVRAQEESAVVMMWGRARPSFVIRYSLEGPPAAECSHHELLNAIDDLTSDLLLREANDQIATKSADQVRNLMRKIEDRKWQLTAVRICNEDDIYRDRLRTRLLPNLETAEQDARRAARVKAAIDRLIELELCWEIFTPISGGPYHYFFRDDAVAAAADFPDNVYGHANVLGNHISHLGDTRKLFCAAEKVLIAMDELIAELTN